jgi:hypothetical protein
LIQSLGGLNLHGYGIKTLGLEKIAHCLFSSDSMAWSFRARKNPPLPGCTHMNCANCQRYALLWREGVLEIIKKNEQETGSRSPVGRDR